MVGCLTINRWVLSSPLPLDAAHFVSGRRKAPGGGADSGAMPGSGEHLDK